jgi:hypothetical protein
MALPRVRTDGFIAPCIHFLAEPPSGPDGVQEIKHDGYRLIVRRDRRAMTRRAISVWPIPGLDQDQEPGQPGDAAGARGAVRRLGRLHCRPSR